MELDARIILTKIVPPEPRGLVARGIVSEAALLVQTCDLLVVTAGAGYGKTSLLTSLARGDQSVAWLTITSPDRDPDLFLDYLERALGRALGVVPPPGAAAGPGRGGAAAGVRVVNWLAQVLQGDLLLFLDDYHKVADVPEIAALLQTLLENLPAGLRVVLGTRVLPDLPVLPRWQATGRAVVIGENRLRLDRDEAATLLAAACHLQPPAEMLDRLLEITEGWALGLQLLGQVLRGRPGQEPVRTEQLLMPSLRQGEAAVGSTSELLFDYFSTEVLKAQHPAMRRFLIEASVLDTLTPDTCDAVLGRRHSRRLLQAVEQRGLFLVRVGADSWRFHNLFRRFLRRELAAAGDRRLALHEAAGAYFTAAGCAEEAVPHWLAAGQHDRAAACVHGAAHRMIQTGRHATLTYWLNLFPAAARERCPDLLYWQGRLQEMRGVWHEALTWYDRAEAGYRRDSHAAGQAEIQQRRAYIALWWEGLPRKAQRYERAVVRLLEQGTGPEDGARLRNVALAHLVLGDAHRARQVTRRAAAAYRREGDREGEAWTLVNPGSWVEFVTGDFSAALARLSEAARAMGGEAGVYFEAERQNCLAANLLFLARFDEARAASQAALSLAEQLESLTLRAWAHRMVGMAWQRGAGADEALAGHHLELALTLAEEIRDIRVLVTAAVGQLRLAHRAADPAAVARTLARCQAYLRRNGDRWLAGHALAHMGLTQAVAAPAAAEPLLRRALRITEAMGDRYHQALAHLGLALVGRTDPGQLAGHLPGALAGVSRYGAGLLGGELQSEMALLAAAARKAGLPAEGLATLTGRPAAPTGVAIRTLGGFVVTVAGVPVPAAAWGGSRARDLCKLLAARHPQPLPKEQVLACLWGHLAREAAENNLYKTLHLLRRVMDPAGAQQRDRYVTLQSGVLGLAADVWVDAGAFTAHVERARQLEAAGDAAAARRAWLAAEQLYAGEFLAEDPYSEWAGDLRRCLQGQWLRVLERLADAAVRAGDDGEAALYLERLLVSDPTQEAVHRRLVECLYRAGRLRQAVEQYQRCCQILRGELGVEPAPETVALSRRLFGPPPAGDPYSPGKVTVR